MTNLENQDSVQQTTSRRGFAKAAVAAVAVTGFGAAALKGVLAGHGDDDASVVSAERRNRRRRNRVGVVAVAAVAAQVALATVEVPVVAAVPEAAAAQADQEATINRSVELQPNLRNQKDPSEGVHNSSTRGFSLPISRNQAPIETDPAAKYRLRSVGVGWHAAIIPITLVALALALSLPRLTTPSVYVFDELYYAYTAGEYVAGDEAYSTAIPPRDDPAIEWTHPPLAKLLIAGGILVAGDTPLGWRLGSVVFGVLGVVIAYLLALSLTGNRATSGLAAGLLLMDSLYLVESRTGMSNLFVLVFANAALLSLARVLMVSPQRAAAPLLATGFFLGLGIATKWSGVALAGLIGLVICWRMVQLWHESRGADVRAGDEATLGFANLRALGADFTDSHSDHRLPRLIPPFLCHRAWLGRFPRPASGHACLSPKSRRRPR